jgi:hypothetical protein
MQSDAAHWCHACLRPIEDSDPNIALVFAIGDGDVREVVLHGRCYDASNPTYRPRPSRARDLPPIPAPR